MTKVYIKYHQSRTGGGPLGNGPYSDREPEFIDTTIKGIYLDKPEYLANDMYSSIEITEDIVSGDELFLLYAIYSDGDTFGYSEGYIHFIGVYKNPQEAVALKKALQEDNRPSEKPKKGPGSKGAYPKGKRNLDEIHKPWTGYFSHLNSLNIESFRLDF